MANVYFTDKFEVCAISDSPEYLYIDDVSAFLKACGEDWIYNNVDTNGKGVYYWNDNCEEWRPANTEIDKKIREIIKQNELSKQGGNVFVGWNILITLDTGETIKTNSEPVLINDVQEAINILLRPSFFGKRIKKFEIVAE